MILNLLKHRYDKYTTRGNDGIIEFILRKIQIKKGFFVEFGAWDGIKNSNCKKLFEEGWDGIFIESDKNRYKQLKKNYIKFNNISCIHAKIGTKKNLFDNVIKLYLKNKKIDFCSIDIDGLDLEVFETFKKYMPTVICIEGGQMLHPCYKRIDASLAKYNIQQSLKVMVDSFKSKSYEILCSYQDSFFIKEDFYSYFNTEKNLLKLYFNGIKTSYHRCPFIKKYLKKVKLKNPIINYILKHSNYSKYKWEKRKLWAENEKEKILFLINKQEKIEIKKFLLQKKKD